MKIEAASRLIKAELTNKIKNEVMRALTSAGMTVDRHSDNVFMAHADSSKVQKALESAGWDYNDRYKEFEKADVEYVISCTASASATKLEFIYNG